MVNIFKAIMGMCDTSPLADDVWSLMDSQIALDLAKV
ncbi:(2Fe-2S)-binding protein, partial [Dehalococcoides mccartyi]